MQVIGLMSGTSVDGIDTALVDIQGQGQDLQVTFLQGATYPYCASLRQQILDVGSGLPLSMAQFAQLDDAIAQAFAQAALQMPPGAELIGSHGQTVFHRPPQPGALGYSLQLGRGGLIAHLTQIETISNFRQADLNLGGQGAPLVPPVDAALLTDKTHDRAVQNIGGIGNVTYLPADRQGTILGWDTGPGNMLLDLAVTRLSKSQQTYDDNGQWAASGQPNQSLLDQWLKHPFFRRPPPKSTGRELFSAAYLELCQADARALNLNAADFLATLTDFTAQSIAQSYQQFLPKLPDQVLLCGGGSRNGYLRQRLQTHLPNSAILTTDDLGLNGDFKEAIAFAVLAYWHKQNYPGNLPEVTGSSALAVLGEIHKVAGITPC
jgi:anhydro-N-acetylmuramic acid kinase